MNATGVKTTKKRKKLWHCRVGTFRRDKGLTLRDVEAATGISNANICQIEHGMDLNLSTAMTLAMFLDAQISELWCKRNVLDS